MNQQLEQLYSEIIEKLKNHQRPQVRLSPELIGMLKEAWEGALKEHEESLQRSSLKKIFCILDNTQTTTSELNDLFIKSLKEIKNHELIVYCLAASQKHLVGDSLKTGKMISFEFFELLKTLVKDQNPEIKEWALRTVETLGPMSLRLKNEVLSAKPGLSKFINKHAKASQEIIDALEREWKRMKL